MIKRTPIQDIAGREGATYAEVDGWRVVDAFPGEPEAPVRDALRLGLADCSQRARVLVEGANAARVIERTWDDQPLAVDRGARLPDGVVYCLRRDRYLLSGPPGAGEALMATLASAVEQDDGLVTITDATHGRAELWLLGPAAPELLSRLCGLDLHPQTFPNLTARQTSVAKTTQLMIRCDRGAVPVYALIGARSLGAYLWQTIVEAAHDLPLQLCGRRFLLGLQGEEAHAD